MFVEIGDRDIGAFFSEQHRDRAANARIAARHERDFAREFSGGFVFGPLENRRGRHFRFDSGLLVLMLRRLQRLFFGFFFWHKSLQPARIDENAGRKRSGKGNADF